MSANHLFIVLLLSVAKFASAQENLSFSNDRFSGISTVTIAPTDPYFNPNPWDVNIFSEDIFLQNDYLYVSQLSLLGLGTANIKTVDVKKNIRGTNTAQVLDYYNQDFSTFHLSSDLLGPSFSFKTKIANKDFQLGLFTRQRLQSSAIGVDNYLRFGNQDLVEPENYLLQPFSLNVMNWGEIGLNLATEIFPYSEKTWVIGANLKYEIGFDALQINSTKSMNLHRFYMVADSIETKTIDASNYHIEASYATNYNFESDQYELKQKGRGFGLDLGISVMDRDLDEEDYNFKASFSILDLGKINFIGQNHIFEGPNVRVENNPNLDNTKFDNPQQYLQILSKEVYGNENASFRGTDFSMGLPTSLHLNFSKNITYNQYLSADWIQRTPIFENSLRRSNIFNVSYTIQKPVVGYGASVSLYEYQSFQLGGYFRIGPLVLGSQNFLPFIFNQKRLHSADFYIALKIYPFWDNEMKRHRRAKCNCE